MSNVASYANDYDSDESAASARATPQQKISPGRGQVALFSLLTKPHSHVDLFETHLASSFLADVFSPQCRSRTLALPSFTRSLPPQVTKMMSTRFD
jgi:hypothetical protein